MKSGLLGLKNFLNILWLVGRGKVCDGLKEPLMRESHTSIGFYKKRRKGMLHADSFSAWGSRGASGQGLTRKRPSLVYA